MSLLSRLLIIALLMSGSAAFGDIISFSGAITQSTQDGTGPAVNNPSLNGIGDGDAYSVKLDFPGSVTGLGAYDPLAGALLTFADGPISEVGFGAVYVNVTSDANPALYDVSLFGCLNTGGGCFSGNSLSVNFSVAAASFNSANATTNFIPGLVPSLDLLEDDGVTDIQGTVTGFSNSNSHTTAPEPSTFAAVCLSLLLVAFLRLRAFRTFQNRSTK